MRLFLVLSVALLLAGCSGERRATPTSPTQAAPGAGIAAAPGFLRPASFNVRNGPSADPPRRDESLLFRQWLEGIYQGSPLQPTTVDLEGAIVWTQEYIVYRRSSCDDATAITNTLIAIDRAPARQPGPGLCGPNGSRDFPDRGDVNRFRQTSLENKYRPMSANRQTTVNLEGDAIWTMEYMRYRMGDCSHQTALDKILIDINSIRSGRGGSPQDVCTPTPVVTPSACGAARPGNCAFQVDRSSVAIAPGGSSFDINILNETRRECTWSVTGVPSFITLLQPNGEVCGDQRVARFQVAANTATARSATIVVAGQPVSVSQTGAITTVTASFVVIPNSDTTSVVSGEQCAVVAVGSNNQMNCTFDATSSSPRPGLTSYQWRFEGSSEAFTGERLSNPLLPCGSFGSLSEPRGSTTSLLVTLTVTGPTGTNSVPRRITFVRNGHC